MSEAHTEPDSAGDWLTVAQAARVLKISERQARRYAGRLEASDRRGAGHEAGHHAGHGAGHAKAAQVRLSAMIEARNEARGVQIGARPDTTPDTLEVGAGHGAGHLEATPDMGPDTLEGTPDTPKASDAAQIGTDYAVRLIEAQAAEIAFLRAQIEAANLNAARWAQQARDAQRLYEKALPAPGDDTASATPEAQSGAQVSQPGEVATAGIIEAQRPEKRGFWRRLIGG
jgi:hypothetical protein